VEYYTLWLYLVVVVDVACGGGRVSHDPLRGDVEAQTAQHPGHSRDERQRVEPPRRGDGSGGGRRRRRADDIGRRHAETLHVIVIVIVDIFKVA